MKKFDIKFLLVTLLALVMVFTLAACGGKNETTASDETTDPSVTDPTVTTPGETEPGETDPTEIDPGETDPVEPGDETDPAETDPKYDPIETDDPSDTTAKPDDTTKPGGSSSDPSTCDHLYSQQTIVMPSCDSAGVIANVCLRCGDTTNESEIPASEHTPKTELRRIADKMYGDELYEQYHSANITSCGSCGYFINAVGVDRHDFVMSVPDGTATPGVDHFTCDDPDCYYAFDIEVGRVIGAKVASLRDTLAFTVDFEDYSGSSQADAHTYAANKLGMYLTDKNEAAASGNVNIVDGNDNKYLEISGPSYVDGAVNGKYSEAKYGLSSGFLDLFYNDKEIVQFTIEFDLTLSGIKGSTSKGSTSNSVFSPYRGVTLLNIGNDKDYFIRATAPGIAMLNAEGNGTDASAAATLSDVGYLYRPTPTDTAGLTNKDKASGSADLTATADNKLAFTNSEMETVASGTVDSAINPDYMRSEGDFANEAPFTYKEGVPMRIQLVCARDGVNTRRVNIEIKIDTDATDGVDNFRSFVKQLWVKYTDLTSVRSGLCFFGESEGGGTMAIDNFTYTPVSSCNGMYHGEDLYTRYTSAIESGVQGYKIVSVCKDCGVTFGGRVVDSDVASNVIDGMYNNTTGFGDFKELTVADNKISKTASNPYWVRFDLSLSSLPAAPTGEDAGYNILLPKATDNYKSLIRLVYLNGEWGYHLFEDGLKYTANSRVATATAGATDTFMIKVDPTTGNYDVYIDMEYVGSASVTPYDDDKKNDSAIVFFDEAVSGATFKNILIFEDKHSHIEGDTNIVDKAVIQGYDAFKAEYVCYCGETAKNGSPNSAIVKAKDAYENYAEISISTTEKEYWIITDVNFRGIYEGESGNIKTDIKAGDYIKLGETAIVTYSATNGADTGTDRYAIRVNTETLTVEIYKNGKCVGTKTLAAAPASVTLGNDGLENVRFNRTQIVTLAADGKLVPSFETVTGLRPCAHTVGSGTSGFEIFEGEIINYKTCSKCGEIYKDLFAVVEGTGGGDYTVKSTTYVDVPESLVVKTSTKPYWISFTFNASKFHSDDNISFLAITAESSGIYCQILRKYSLGGSDECKITLTGGGPELLTAKLNTDYRIDIKATPNGAGTLALDGYVNGEYVVSKDLNISAVVAGKTDYKLRITDKNSGWDLVVKDFKVQENVDEAHEHTSEWNRENDYSVAFDKNTATLSYKCYCGENIPYMSISSVVNDGLYDFYMASKSTEITANSNKYWLLTELTANGNTLYAGNYVTIGGTVVYSISENSESGSTKIAVSVDGDENTYKLFVDGVFVKKASFEVGADLTKIVLGSSDALEARLNYTKLVTFGETDTPAVPTFAVHTHTTEGCTYVIKQSATSFNYDCNCYCGELICSNVIDATLTDTLDSVYYGNETISYDATGLDAYWVVMDVNVRNAALDGNSAIVTVGGNVAVKVSDIGATKPMTVGVAVRVDSANGCYEIFIDGKYYGTISAVASSDEVVLGDTGLDENDVRFKYVKIITASEQEAFVPTFNDTSDTYAPCVTHDVIGVPADIKVTDTAIELAYKYCNICGEVAYNTITKATDTLVEESVNNGEVFNSEQTFTIDKDIVSKANKGTYVIKFTADINTLNPGSGNKSFFTIYSTKNGSYEYQHMLRMYAISDGTGGYYTDKAYLRFNHSDSAPVVTTIENGKSYEFMIFVTPSYRGTDKTATEVYVNGEFMGCYENMSGLGTDANKYTVRFIDGNKAANMAVKDFEVFNLPAFVHEHTDKWCAGSDYGIIQGIDSMSLTYKCYCGEQIDVGAINDVVDTFERIIGSEKSVSFGASEGEWIAADINVRVATTDKLVTIGGETLLSGADITAPDTVRFAVRADVAAGKAAVYYNGEFIKDVDVDYTANPEVTFNGSDNVRVMYLKQVHMGSGTEVKPTFKLPTDVLFTCSEHELKKTSLIGTIMIAKCKVCGEIVDSYNVSDEIISMNEALDLKNMPIKNATYINAPDDIISKNAVNDFWIGFNFNVNSYKADDNKAFFSTSTYVNILRKYKASDYTSGNESKIKLRLGSNGADIGDFEYNKTYRIDLKLTPNGSGSIKIDAYVDGAYVASETISNSNTEAGKNAQYRFTDDGSNMLVTNFGIHVAPEAGESITRDATDGAFVRGGDSADTVMGLVDDKYLEIKEVYDKSSSYARAIYLKFNISDLDCSKVILNLPFSKEVNVDKANYYCVTKVSDEWNSSEITANNIPVATEYKIEYAFAEGSMKADITPLVVAAVNAGENVLSVMVNAMVWPNGNSSQAMIYFENGNKPEIILEK